MPNSAIYVAGTFDIKSAELGYLAETLKNAELRIKTLDLSATGIASSADVSAQDVAGYHPEGNDAVFTGDRGTAVAGMAIAFKAWTEKNVSSIGGMISAGGSGGTALVTPAMPFNNSEARDSLFQAIRNTFVETENRRLIDSPHHINSAEFCDAAVAALHDIV